jgi:hypothetical protein
MCHKHHVETDDVSIWTVEKMRELKAAHEGQFEEAVEQITQAAIHDITKEIVTYEPLTLARLNTAAGWSNSPAELQGTLEHNVLPLLARLGKLVPDLRAILLIIVEHGEDRGEDVGITTFALEQITGRGPGELWPHLHTLQARGFTSVDEDPITTEPAGSRPETSTASLFGARSARCASRPTWSSTHS